MKTLLENGIKYFMDFKQLWTKMHRSNERKTKQKQLAFVYVEDDQQFCITGRKFLSKETGFTFLWIQ